MMKLLNWLLFSARFSLVLSTLPFTNLALLRMPLFLLPSRHSFVILIPLYRKKAEYLPPSAQKNKNVEKDIINEYRKLVGMTEVNAKYRYVQLCRSLKTYGITFFKTKVCQMNCNPSLWF